MKKVLCSVFDEKSCVFSNPVYMRTKGEAIRAFEAEINKKESALGQYPEDHKLYVLGFFDDNSGLIEGVAQPEFIISGTDFKQGVKENGNIS
jgi:hypothetical protein